MQTFKKLPKIKPRTKPMASYAVSGVTSEVYGEAKTVFPMEDGHPNSRFLRFAAE
jgi:hypothetical protein